MKFQEKGTVKDIKKIIVRIDGLPSCLNGQIVDFGEQTRGIIMGFSEQEVLALVLGDDSKIRMGQQVTGTSEPFTIPVGSGCLGRMVDALGQRCDEGEPIPTEALLPVFGASPHITERAPVTDPLHSGTKVVDVLVPIGKGQRQLILGDRMTGKTVIALDAILNQRVRNVVCIYCCIGKAVSALEKVVGILAEKDALRYTVILAATDNASVGEQYIAPFAAATIGDFFMRQGRDVLVIFDDVTKHAWAYRQLSLLLERPPGREAYPGDIFYIHTLLMERAGKLNAACGGGSMTFLAIADTLMGDLTGYIPSNLISMCDGQIVLSTVLFGEGARPAIDFALSMSIVGGRAQPPILRDLSATLRLEYSQCLEVQRLSKLQTGISREAERTLKKGRAIMAVLQQFQYHPVSVAEEALLLYALREGVLTDLAAEELTRFKEQIFATACGADSALVEEIEKTQTLSPAVERRLQKVVNVFFESGARPGAG
jgi:F-type H+-transporting ATPase subunit alpha